MMVCVADFILGLFVGMLALASCAPKSLAVEVYRNAWVFWGLFIFSAYQTTPYPHHFFSVFLLIAGGLAYIKSLQLEHKQYEFGLIISILLLTFLSFFTQSNSLASGKTATNSDTLIFLVLLGIGLVLTVGLMMVRKHANAQTQTI
jgi:hypothetical protein